MKRMLKCSIACCALLLVALCSACMAGLTYYVAASGGSDNNDGLSQSTPWASINKGDQDEILNPGDTVVLLDGTFDVSSADNGPILSNRSGTRNAPITYCAQTPGQVVIDRGANSNNGDSAGESRALRLDHVSYIVVDGIHFTGGNCTLQLNEVHNVEIKNCWLSDKIDEWAAAVNLSGSTSFVNFHNNVIGPGVYNPCILDWNTNGYNKFNNNVFVSSSDWAYQGGGLTPGTELRNNIFYGCYGGINTNDSSMVHTNNIFYAITQTYSSNTWQGSGEILDTDPMLSNPGGNPYSGNYALLSGSPCIDAGIYVGLSFNGSAPDIGISETSGTAGSVGSLSGTITDATTNSSVSQANLQLWSGNAIVWQTQSDDSGNYTISCPSGSYELVVKKSGYQSTSVDVSVSGTADVQLTPGTPVYYVDAVSGSDSASGVSPSHAWLTIDKGDRDGLLNPGDTVILLDGTYDVSTVSDGGLKLQNCNGSSSAPITYKAQNSLGAIVDRGQATGNGESWALRLQKSSCLVFDGIHFEGGNITFYLNATDNIEVKNCQFSDRVAEWGPAAFWINDAAGNTLVHNSIFGPNLPTPGHGIVDDGTVGNNKFFNNVIIGVEGTGYRCTSGNQSPIGCEFRNNIVYDCNEARYCPNTNFTCSNNMFFEIGNDLGYPSLQSGETSDVDPLFVDVADGNYHLAGSSPAIDAGIDVGLTYYGSTPDIGAFEHATTYYVAASGGSDNNDGVSQSTAWATIDRGDRDSVLCPGDTVILLDGTYDVSDVSNGGPILQNCNGSPSAPITYKAQSLLGAVVDRGQTTGNGESWALRLQRSANLVLDGIHFKGGNITSYLNATDNIEVKNCQFSDKVAEWGPAAFWINDAAGNTLVHNNIFGPNLPTPGHGIVDDGTVGNNKFFNNVIIGAEGTGYRCTSGNQLPIGCEFRNNIVYDCNEARYCPNTNLACSNNMFFAIGNDLGYPNLGSGETMGVDPLLVDVVGGDYQLKIGSPAIDAGIDVGLKYAGSAPDIGAFEHAQTKTPEVTGSIGDVKNEDSGTVVGVESAIVTGVYNGFFYIEDESRACGIKVVCSASVSTGDVVSVVGTIAVENDEKYINADSTDLSIDGTGEISSVGMTNKAMQECLSTGILAKVWGTVTAVASDLSYVYINDGSNVDDGSGNTGVKVLLSDNTVARIAPLYVDEAVSVTGIIGRVSSGYVIRPRATLDVSNTVADTITVTSSDMNGWISQASGSTGSTAFVSGPDTAPLGDGSIQLSVGTDGSGAINIRTNNHAGLLLSDITEMLFSTYMTSFGDSGGKSISVMLNIQLDDTYDDENGYVDDQLLYDPYYSDSLYALCELNVWQNWDPLNVGKWYSTGGLADMPNGTYGTLAQYIAAYPAAKIAPSASGGFRLFMGWWSGYWNNCSGCVDNVRLGTKDGTTVYDFEP